ncbi:hypothetical protein PROH_12445 [Prochlorothrix hollandica PCC 9006 = CALU 1027]|uniref:Uncharacterized protein n=1 Tax=Prochlorothrix hollandica PCC 9006 = CALU 1027 TaxID=317619 RepID=A0A0M2PW82_PROHO|nr:hypothetical protein PROH_12445 [Prochlorothrix hollandica PCC 9006 = CALU 1027]
MVMGLEMSCYAIIWDGRVALDPKPTTSRLSQEDGRVVLDPKPTTSRLSQEDGRVILDPSKNQHGLIILVQNLGLDGENPSTV